MAIAVVQTKSNAAIADNQTVTLDAPATNGNLLIAVGWCIASGQTLSVTDGGGSMSWASAVVHPHSAFGHRLQVFWGVVSGAPQTITFNSSGTGLTTGHVVEASGMAATPVDVTGTGESSAATSHALTSAITPTVADVLLIGAVGSNTAASFTLPGGYTRIGVAAAGSDAGYQIVSAIAAYDFATTSAAAENGVTVLAAFKAAGGGGGGNPWYYYAQQ